MPHVTIVGNLGHADLFSGATDTVLSALVAANKFLADDDCGRNWTGVFDSARYGELSIPRAPTAGPQALKLCNPDVTPAKSEYFAFSCT